MICMPNKIEIGVMGVDLDVDDNEDSLYPVKRYVEVNDGKS